ncbi:MAG: hypothetical protein JW731_04020 [Bacteroidales bacterium]|nr:hypothetical protein [Bacteroidales bacterium]
MKKYLFIILLTSLANIILGQNSIENKDVLKVEVLKPAVSEWKAVKYELFEVGMILPDRISILVNQFLSKRSPNLLPLEGLNPFDPDDISVEATFFPPGYPENEVSTIYGFFYKDYETIETPLTYHYWKEIETTFPWRVRFSPDKPGEWSVGITVVTRDETVKSETYRFICADSGGKGFLEVNKNNNRYLEYADTKEDFFAIGMNVAFPGYPAGCFGSDSKKMDEHRKYISALGETKANFCRLVLGPKTYNFEWEELGNYDAPFTLSNKTSPKIEKVGRLALAWEFDKSMNTIEKSELNTIICFEIHFPFMYFNPYYPDDPYRWINNPYKAIPGVTEVADFFTNPEAIKIYQYKLRYFFARWGYSPYFTGFEFLSEMEFTGGKIIDGKKYYPYHESEEFRAILTEWYAGMTRYLRDELHVKQLLSSSYSFIPHENDRSNSYFDFVSMHRYGKLQAINSTHRKNEINKYLSRWDKPFIFGETGMPDEAARINKCMDNSFSNDIWAMAMMGGFGTGLYWWWSYVIDQNYHWLFNPLADFFEAVDMENNNFTVRHGGKDYETDPRIEYLALTDSAGKAAIGWVHNYQVYWNNLYNQYEYCIDENNLKDLFTESQVPEITAGGVLFLEGLKPGSKYSMKWFNTRNGKWKKQFCKTNSNASGTLRIRVPKLGNNTEVQSPPTEYGFIIELIK